MKNTTKKISTATIVTNQILDQLKDGTVSWHKEWNGVPAYNYVSGKAYSALNQLGLKGGAYLTFNQVKTLGGKVKKGSKSAIVCFFTFFDKTENVQMKNLATEKTEEKEMVKTKSCLKYFRVFHRKLSLKKETLLFMKILKLKTLNLLSIITSMSLVYHLIYLLVVTDLIIAHHMMRL